MINENLYSTIIRNAEGFGGKNVSHNSVKKASFQPLFKGQCSDREKHGWQKLFEFEERPALVHGLTAVIERGCVV